MKRIFSSEKSILIAPFFIVLFVFFVPISSSIKSIMLVISLISILFTPYYRTLLPETYNTFWGWSAAVLFLYIVIASLWSDAPFTMRLSAIDKYSKLIYLPFFAVGFINPKTRQWALNAYFASMLITCTISLLKKYGLITFNAPDTGEVFHNHIATGYMVALAVYLAAVLFFQKNVSKWQRIYYLIMMIFGSYQVFFLNTGRTGYIIYGLLISLLIIQKLSFKKAMIGIMVFCGSVLLVYTQSPLMQVRTHSLITDIEFLKKHEENTSLGFRVQFHEYAKNLFKRHPIFGLGTGSFKYRFSQEQPIPSWDVKLNDPHSQYWQILAEQGIVGLVLLLIFLGSLFLSLLQLKESRPILLGTLISFCAGSFSDTIFCYSTAGTLLIIISALCFGEFIEKEKRATCPELIKEGTMSSQGAELAI